MMSAVERRLGTPSILGDNKGRNQSLRGLVRADDWNDNFAIIEELQEAGLSCLRLRMSGSGSAW